MGYEEDLEITEDYISRISKDSLLEIHHSVCKDVISSGKVRFKMKNKPKVKVFALIMYAVMTISSMAVLAGATSGSIGSTAEDKATIALYAYTYHASAYTTPALMNIDCSTTVTAYGFKESKGYGVQSAFVEVLEEEGATKASSTHQAGSSYGTLSVAV